MAIALYKQHIVHWGLCIVNQVHCVKLIVLETICVRVWLVGMTRGCDQDSFWQRAGI